MSAPASQSSQTFYKADPDGGDRLERAVYSTADAVDARFDGYFPDPEPPAAAKTKASGGSASSSGSSSS